MLPVLPRLAHLVEDRLNTTGHIAPLLLEEANPRQLQEHMLAGCFYRSRRQLQRWGF
jgi:hypothetical protein